MHYSFDRWFLSRPRWERLLTLICFVWASVMLFLSLVQGTPGEQAYLQAALVGPGWALFVYGVARMVALLGRKRETHDPS